MAILFDDKTPHRYPGQPRQKPKPEEEILERGNGILLKRVSHLGQPYVIVPLDRRWTASFTHEEDARLFFNIKNGGL